MNLTSCEECGVVLDKDYLIFPDIYDYDTQEIIMENVEWDGENYVAVLPCPVCKHNIKK